MSKKILMIEVDTGISVRELRRKNNLTLLINVGSRAIEIPINQVHVNPMHACIAPSELCCATFKFPKHMVEFLRERGVIQKEGCYIRAISERYFNMVGSKV